MAALVPQVVQIAGTAPTANAASAGGDTVPTGDRTWIHVTNGSGSSVTVTIATPGTVSGLAIADVTVAIPAGTGKDIGPLTTALFGDNAAITYSATTSVTVAALSI
ncbi:hypothetical protein [Jatrophihabitans sp.]|uniref:hypothetical protein n=1 Tax=Jatrophihabitans sp. TaxID=1932789 RepID=UPI0030C6C833|nr:31, phiSA1p11 [Jatrophihabitans sp.]